jgi:hypothetical protein
LVHSDTRSAFTAYALAIAGETAEVLSTEKSIGGRSSFLPILFW